MILRNDPDHACLCPLQQILALAIADRALVDDETIEDLTTRHRPPPGQPFKIVPVRAQMLEVPLLRPCSDGLGVNPRKIWSYHYLHALLTSLGERAGYSDRLLPYNFRRGHGGVLDRKWLSLLTFPLLV